MNTAPFDWKRFHAYRVFDEFLERFIIQQKSYVTTHDQPLDLEAAFSEIEEHFNDAIGESEATFEERLAVQFDGASEQSKIVFANIEYLWAMPVGNLNPETKRSYALRWFGEPDHVVSGEGYFFKEPHTIANPGRGHNQNKHIELTALLRVMCLVSEKADLTDLIDLKRQIAEICHSAIYEGVPEGEKFAVTTVCAIHSLLLNLADPDRYESIVSASHREQICGVLGHVVENPSTDREVLLKQIRETLWESYGNAEKPHRKYRWFFYAKDVKPLWFNKDSKKAQRVSSAVFDVQLEEEAVDLEATKVEVTGFRIHRSAKLVKAAKERDNYTCQACTFHFENQIVHVHHLDPISEYKRPKETKLKDLITLCPNCHYLAHYWLRKSSRYKDLESLLKKLSPK